MFELLFRGAGPGVEEEDQCQGYVKIKERVDVEAFREGVGGREGHGVQSPFPDARRENACAEAFGLL